MKHPICFSSSLIHLLLVLFLSPTMISSLYDGGNETDYEALLNIKLMITQDPYGALSSWNDSLHFCNWRGVLCSRNRRVRFLVLKSQGIEGSLSPYIGNLTFLLWLSLGNNSFQGIIPQELNRLSRLRILHLYLNEFSGVIPINISGCSKLQKLNLEKNKLVGSIPSEISFLSELAIVSFEDNYLSGGIPPSMGNITSMVLFSITDNPLGGNIPDTLGNWKYLQVFLGASCNLSGTIPDSLYNLSLLSNISLADNQLTGSLPLNIGALFPRLLLLQLWGNQLTGTLPPFISNCSRLTDLEIGENKFSEKLTIDFAKLRHIEFIYLSHNNFGSSESDEMKFIDSLSNCTQLKVLGLSDCKFQGVLPSSIGNRRLCGGLIELGFPRCEQTKKDTKVFHLLIIAVLIALTVFTIPCLAYACCKKSKTQSSKSVVNKQFSRVSYNQLLKATNGFSEANLIGNGGFGSVYKGILGNESDRYVAVKVLHPQDRGAQRSFERECEVWRNIRHRNLLKIITSCSSIDFQGNNFKALVYEFMPNGSLHDWLHPTSRLNILQVITILTDVASALDYIHSYSVPSIVHGDLKPSNILLDDGMVAHVGDFGLARFYETSNHNSSTGIKGTVGYVAPEYGLGNEVTTSGDVYSFGIVLLEMMTGKNPSDNIFNEDFNLHTFASMSLNDRVIDVIDLNILNVYQEDDDIMQNWDASAKKIEECLAAIIKIGVSCTLRSPRERVKTEKVLRELQCIQRSLQNI